eukprot:jgi/Psemu1/29445/gm1.29445_g
MPAGAIADEMGELFTPAIMVYYFQIRVRGWLEEQWESAFTIPSPDFGGDFHNFWMTQNLNWLPNVSNAVALRLLQKSDPPQVTSTGYTGNSNSNSNNSSNNNNSSSASVQNSSTGAGALAPPQNRPLVKKVEAAKMREAIQAMRDKGKVPLLRADGQERCNHSQQAGPTLGMVPRGICLKRWQVPSATKWRQALPTQPKPEGNHKHTIIIQPKINVRFSPIDSQPVYVPRHTKSAHRIQVKPKDTMKLGVLFQSRKGESPLIGIPLTNPMGWKSSPLTFCTCTENIADLVKATLATGLTQARLQPHWLDLFLEAPPEEAPPADLTGDIALGSPTESTTPSKTPL